MTRQLTGRDLALVLIVVAVLGFAFVPIKWALVEVPPFALAALRFFFAAVPAIAFVARPAAPWRLIFGYGFAIGFGQFGLLFLGMKLGMPAGLSSVVIQLQVFFTIALAVMFDGDRLHRWNLFGGGVSLIGVVVLGAYKLYTGASTTLIGFLLVTGSALAWAIGNLFAKRARHADMFSLVVWSSLIPPLPLAFLSYAFEGGPAVLYAVRQASWVMWASALILAWGATLFGFASWNRLLHRYPTALISPFSLLIPVSGLASGALFLDERLAVPQAFGVLLVFAGLVINVYGARLWTVMRRTA